MLVAKNISLLVLELPEMVGKFFDRARFVLTTREGKVFDFACESSENTNSILEFIVLLFWQHIQDVTRSMVGQTYFRPVG